MTDAQAYDLGWRAGKVGRSDDAPRVPPPLRHRWSTGYLDAIDQQKEPRK